MTDTVPTPTRVDVYAPPTRVARSTRNLFAYHETPQPAPRTMISAAPPPAVFEQPATVTVPDPPRPPHFPWRYIGRFGTASDPIAAFVRDGEVRTVRSGDRIDERFVLRRIGNETVEVETQEWPERIPVALSSAI